MISLRVIKQAKNKIENKNGMNYLILKREGKIINSVDPELVIEMREKWHNFIKTYRPRLPE